ncbi:NUDIX domain-containing protein [Paenibacillus rhizovicinus]|uniref:NUDIX domain-containing protein n=1 Tax=Paenibacillus rhizovicinus TaxID=2704463 RepID=A0A6C0P5Q8_9BACL|nr:NUDIX domain-containing protein [Paenibacillus rhizovicinus]QHW33890.1 NUDIX domain-containing protein [Paenibacillus rhizovicinus]
MQLLNRITDRDILGGEPDLLPSVNRYASRGVLLDEEANVAMMYMAKSSLYKLPGGGVEAKETPEVAFLREIREETGYDAEILEPLGYIEEHKKRNHYLQLSYCFIARASQAYETQLTANEKRLGMTAQWMTIEQALDVMNTGLASCTDYSTGFMLLRDKLILEEAAKWLAFSDSEQAP